MDVVFPLRTVAIVETDPEMAAQNERQQIRICHNWLRAVVGTEREQQILRLYDARVKVEEICREMHCSTQTVYAALRKFQVPLRMLAAYR